MSSWTCATCTTRRLWWRRGSITSRSDGNKARALPRPYSPRWSGRQDRQHNAAGAGGRARSTRGGGGGGAEKEGFGAPPPAARASFRLAGVGVDVEFRKIAR